MPTIRELENARKDAKGNMIAAWKEQSLTTIEEGFSFEEAQAATRRALMAEARYYEACRQLDEAYTKGNQNA